MTGDGFPYPVDRPGNFAVKSEGITAEQLLPFGYAPGGYMMKCPTCRAETYNVDKRARRCWQCAVNAFRAHAQHQPLSAEAEDDREIDRILAMSGDELRAELVAEGHDPDVLVRQMKQGLDGTLRLAADRQRWREEAASWRRVAERLQERANALEAGLKPFAAVLADGEPVGPIPRGLLDSRITRNDLRTATKLLDAQDVRL